MKKSLFFKIVVCLMCIGLVLPQGISFADSPSVASESAVLMDWVTGTVLFEKNPDTKLYPASTTKVMTGILAIEYLDPEQIVTISQTAIDIDRDGSNIGLLWNEEISVSNLIYGLLVSSANDAANALAENVSGNIEEFVKLMNAKAKELGMSNTNFVNTHGYHNDNHYTTARDLAVLCRYAMQNEMFRHVVGTAQYEIAPTNKYEEVRPLSNNNALINPNKGWTHHYSPAKGIKTGHTSVAGACLTAYAEKDNMKLISVTMKAPSSPESFVDTKNLFEYGFNNFSHFELANTKDVICKHEVKWAKGDDNIVVKAKDTVSGLLPKNYDKEKLVKEISIKDDLYAPVKMGEVIGEIKYRYDEKEVGYAELTVGEDVSRSVFQMIFDSIFTYIVNMWVIFPLGLIVAVLLIKRTMEIKRQEEMRRRRKNKNRQEFYR